MGGPGEREAQHELAGAANTLRCATYTTGIALAPQSQQKDKSFAVWCACLHAHARAGRGRGPGARRFTMCSTFSDERLPGWPLSYI